MSTHVKAGVLKLCMKVWLNNVIGRVARLHRDDFIRQCANGITLALILAVVKGRIAPHHFVAVDNV